LTPPDVISQSLLAIPIWLLFELGLIASRIFLKDKVAEEVIMENDEFTLIEEAPVVTEGDSTTDAHDDEDHDLSDEEMEKIFDDAEAEEEDNNKDDEADDESDKKS